MKNVINMISSTIRFARSSSEYAHKKTTEYIEENVIKGNYVTREEYDNLYHLVLEVKNKLEKLNFITESKRSD